ncbi:SEC-C metal-binding domain-containing protein [Streptomyces sp. NPDC018693]
MARRGEATDWPPPRNGTCWCGSQRKYKKCCGSPTFV